MTRDKFCGILNYHFKALFDNKIVVMITHDNKNMKRSSYYHFKALFESKEFYHDYER